MTKLAHEPWWTPFYDDLLAALFLEQTSPDAIDQTIAFIADRLALAPGARIFDQCCGVGRLSLPLAERGYEVVGIDQAGSYIEHAQAQVQTRGLSVAFHTADAFDFVPEKPCAGAINWWTSFGYATNDHTNLRMLERAFEALEPGGRFMLDGMNLPGLLRDFQRDSVTRCTTTLGEIVLLRESTLDFSAGVLHKRWSYFLANGERVVHDSAVRLYMPHTIAEMLSACGFVDIELFGDIDAQELTINSPRCILLARRPMP
ncbi:MAG: class I SAM-dependent methyltransferase [Bradymonadaceae bacterium]|nr:class I SAM-dependent methyltransferase [Lujinxingiaceae bacterium]